MHDLVSIQSLCRYSDSANRQVLAAAAALDGPHAANTDPAPASLLDQPLDIGVGSLRKILQHILNGELTWLKRMQGEIECKWPGEKHPLPLLEVRERLEEVFQAREEFLRQLDPGKLDRMQDYRDSRGSLYRATLRDMLLQGIVHSIHHRAQVVNAIRRLGGSPPEVDYMVARRQGVA
jgi:uncharacterized damage-inducible protein DinB